MATIINFLSLMQLLRLLFILSTINTISTISTVHAFAFACASNGPSSPPSRRHSHLQSAQIYHGLDDASPSVIAGTFHKKQDAAIPTSHSADTIPQTTWYIDGNNLKGQQKVPSNREEIVHLLRPMARERHTNSKRRRNKPSRTNVVLVFDGRCGEVGSSTTNDGRFTTIITQLPESADDRLVATIREHADHRAYLVTADKELIQRVAELRALNGGCVVHPSKFWNQYLPNLIGTSRAA